MTALLLIGLMGICAKLWFDADTLRDRVFSLEASVADPRAEPVVVPHRDARTISADPVDIAQRAVEPIEIDREEAPTDRQDHVVPAAAPVIVVTEPIAELVHDGIGFEELFGRKLPIWAGGVTLAVAGFLIVKYSIDAGLLSPIVRVVMGLLFGTALIVAAEGAMRQDARVRDPRVRQALAGAGVATLYASILVAADLYHLVGPITAFAGLALTTALAGILSLRFGAPSAVLGLVGGLAAPAVVGTGSPDVPLLATYLALAVGGLCALSRTQRWAWLGVSALVGGFGWGALLILSAALDATATLSIGAYMMLLGFVLPLIVFDGARATPIRMAGSLAACVQIAALVTTGGFGGLDWGLLGLVSIAVVWLSRRDRALAELAVVGLAIALSLALMWPHPDAAMLAVVIGAIAAIFGLPAIMRLWRDDARLSDAGQLAAIAIAIVALPWYHLPLADRDVATLALLGAVVAMAAAALGWRGANERDDRRFAMVTASAAGLLALAAMIVVPAWLISPVIAVTATALLMVADRVCDPRVEVVAWWFGTTALTALAAAPAADTLRAVGIIHANGGVAEAIRWGMPSLAAMVFAWRGRIAQAGAIAQPAAVLLGYVALAQVVPTGALPILTVVLLGALASDRRLLAAMIAAAALAGGWAAWPLAHWLLAGGEALAGVPLFVTALPGMSEALSRLALPSLAAGVVAWHWRGSSVARSVAVAAGILAVVAGHVLFKQLFAIADTNAFVQAGMTERTAWEMLLAAVAVTAWRRWPIVAQALAAASLGHFLIFTALLHDPLWSLQAVGAWPVANLLLPAYGTAFALTCWADRIDLPPVLVRGREWLRMVLIMLFVATSLRQLLHGTVPMVGTVSEREDIARSVLLIALAVGFLHHGIAVRSRDWRIASLVLMLAAAAKVFLSDAAGLDGLLRIASFAALGFSLIGIGWLYSRYLPQEPVLTPDSRLADTATEGN